MRPSLRDSEIQAQSGLPTPKGVSIAALVVVVVLIFVLSDGDSKPPRGQGE